MENIDNLENNTPEDIARTIFSKDASPPQSVSLIGDSDHGDVIYIFEILLTILMEGFNILLDIQHADLSGFNSETIEVLNPWIESLGFTMNVREYDFDNKTAYGKYYCRIRLNRGNYVQFFRIKNISKSYHFCISGTNYEDNNRIETLKDLYAIFKNENKIYAISFDFL